jgi:hypothetical protein
VQQHGPSTSQKYGATNSPVAAQDWRDYGSLDILRLPASLQVSAHERVARLHSCKFFNVQRNAFWLAESAFCKDWRVKSGLGGFHAAPEQEFKAPAKDRHGGRLIFVVD